MRIIFILISCFIAMITKMVFAGHIKSWDLEAEYNYDGYAKSISLIFNLESGLGPNEYFQIIWPSNIGT